ncbi:protein of unknown function [Nitrospira japonica]|uniref:Uncharacterized protein n=1 Tax=Nitrospira japonica TaxID=1325564 RepID=A0A1W1IAB2_9BACT|nr:protein of unknown function [Nitrospira japonica]
MLPLGVACTYTWGPRTKEWGQSALTVAVIDVSKPTMVCAKTWFSKVFSFNDKLAGQMRLRFPASVTQPCSHSKLVRLMPWQRPILREKT